MNIHIHIGVSDADSLDIASVLTNAFADYPVEISFTPDSLRAMYAADDVLPGACSLARDPQGRLLGVGLSALRGDRGRVAAMGVVREAHRQGFGRAIGEAVLDALARAGARDVILEALTVNAPALALYERHLGFERRRRLVGFTRPPGGEPIDPPRWEQALSPGGEPDSWQLGRVLGAAREQTDLVSVPAVIPEYHPVAEMLRKARFSETAIDQYELGRLLL